MAGKVTHEVVHPKLFLAVGGKLQLVPAGTQLLLTDAMAKSLGSKVKSLAAKKTVKLKTDD